MKFTLKGVEVVEGKKAYVVEVEPPDGKKATEYYDMEIQSENSRNKQF
ncbi:MAG: hypothetical protein H6569_07175 [Lewinellaceae bacterium]|nr:hypothetical protein [Lewinellaceae bacterium]